jgi:uncharacterized membrane protein YeaQ/YmgE (transglycosylase-associated protein family)
MPFYNLSGNQLVQEEQRGNRMEYGIIAWLVIGAIAGWLAGQVVKGGGFGLIVDIIVGIVGAVIGGFLAGALGISTGGGIIGSIIVAFIGAVILLFILRLIKRA